MHDKSRGLCRGCTRVRGLDKQKFRLLSLTINQGCSFACPYCLPKGTKVLLNDFSWKPIENIEVGDHIISILEKKNRWAVGRVLITGSRIAKVYRLHTSDGKYLDLTDDHPLLTPGHKWRHIGQAPIQAGRRIAKIPFIDWEIDEDYRIDWGKVELSFDDILDIVDENRLIVLKRMNKKLEEKYGTNYRQKKEAKSIGTSVLDN